MRTITETYEEVASYQEGTKACSSCSKKFTRTFKEFQTINPWNNKTRTEINEENEEKLGKFIIDWEAREEQCSVCKKAKIPDIVLDLITKSQWEATEELRNEIEVLRKTISSKNALLENAFKGRHVALNTLGKQRYGIVDYFNNDGAWTSFQYTLLRADLKGETASSDQIRPHDLFNVPDERNSK